MRNQKFAIISIVFAVITIASYMIKVQFSIDLPIINFVGFISELTGVALLLLWARTKSGKVKIGAIFLSLFFLFLFLGNVSFYYFFYYLKIAIPKINNISYPVLFYKMGNLLNIIAVLCFLPKNKKHKFFFNPAMIISVLLSFPIIFRFSEPIFLNSAITNNPLLFGIEIFGIVGSFIIFNFAFLILMSSNTLFWSTFSGGQIIYIITGWSIKLERLLNAQQAFVSYEYVFSYGTSICALSSLFLFFGKQESLNLNPYDSDKLFAKGRLFSITITFLAILFMSFPQGNTFSLLQFVNVSSAIGVLVTVFTGLVITDTLEKFTSNVEQLIREGKDLKIESSNITPKELAKSIEHILSYKEKYQKKIETMNRNQLLAAQRLNISRQVAHDIKSPLTALRMVTTASNNLLGEQKKILTLASQRIEDIANNLLQTEKGSQKKSLILVSSLLEAIVSEKRAQYRTRPEVQIKFDDTKSEYGKFVSINSENISRCLSNIINNSVEAIVKNSIDITLSFHLSHSKETVDIVIEDNGKGIPPSILKKLNQGIGTTYGKSNLTGAGTGRGLTFSYQAIEANHGSLCFFSTLGKGTKVVISLPIAEQPSWFANELRISSRKQIVILDDEVSVHDVWRGRLTKENTIDMNKILSFTDPAKFVNWYCSENQSFDETTIYLIDYDFLDSQDSGLDIIKKLGLKKNVLLVTSRYYEENIISECARNSIKLLPKNLLWNIPLR